MSLGAVKSYLLADWENTSCEIQNLSELLRDQTSSEHAQISKHPHVQAMIKGSVTKQSYFQYLTDLHHIYSCLENENEFAMKKELRLTFINFPDLARTNHIAQDLKAASFQGLEATPSKEATDYAVHLQWIRAMDPLLLIAHNYVHYLGDLSGGQILKNALQKLWPDAVNYYDFSELFSNQNQPYKTPLSFKTLYKTRLDGITLTKKERALLLKETHNAYDLTKTLLDAADHKLD